VLASVRQSLFSRPDAELYSLFARFMQAYVR